MRYQNIILLTAGLLCCSFVKAQDTLATPVTFDLTTEAAVGTGDYTAYQLTANRHHVLGTRSNTAYLRGAVNVEHDFSKDLSLSGAVDIIGSVHADHKVYLQQAYRTCRGRHSSWRLAAGSNDRCCATTCSQRARS